MRAPLLVVLLTLVAPAVFAQPLVTAQISSDDIQQICKVIAAMTAEPVKTISPVITEEYAPGAIPQPGTHIPAKGTPSSITLYARIDRVWVRTGYKDKSTGGWYDLQKLKDAWKIVRKSSWTD